MHRVAVTGLGVLSPNGVGLDSLWESLKSGKSGVSRITKFDVSDFTSQIAGEFPEFDLFSRISPKEAKRLDPFCQYALYASAEAIEDSRLDLDEVDKDKIGVVYASGIGGEITWEREHKKLLEKGPRRVSPFFIPGLIINTAPGTIAIRYGFRGPNFGVTSACASSGHAIGEAFRKVRSGEADIMVTGGSEAPLGPLALAGFCALRALSTRNDEPERASRPFDKDRDGFIMSEGAATLVLERMDLAEKRGAKIYGEIIGYGASDDAFHITAPDETGEAQALGIKRALKDGNIKADDIKYINAHGTSTLLNDKVETLAVKNVFKERAYDIKISSTKSMTGHLLGAASAVEAIATLMALRESIIPPTINYETPDPECDLDYTPNKAVEMEIEYAISNSFGFGGHNVTLVFKKYKGE
ncbi:beta-ketoacyl-ACP synthase II [candidate division WOR-3 bacterium]|nr:beta-ketoacyl-ACP synthase II [candidate division WOR-3 bacterium]MCK4529217.1 beta-ketoacyl-ACP synthase II [candidate division WOR-3 bacterium]